MKKILVPVMLVVVGVVAYAGANVEAHACCSHQHEGTVGYGNGNMYKRYCPKHGWWDMRGGTFSCPGCMAPKFGF